MCTDLEDVQSLPSFVSCSTKSASDTGHNTSSSTTSHSLDSPLLPFNSSSTNSVPIRSIPEASVGRDSQSKHPRSNRSLSNDYGAPNEVTDQVIPCSKLPTRSKSFNGDLLRSVCGDTTQKRLHGVDEALSSQQAAPFIDVSHHSFSSPTSSTPHSSLTRSPREKSQQLRKSIDLGSTMMQASLRRLRRPPSLWTTTDRSLSINDTRDRYIHDIRAESQLSDQEKLVALKRARKIAQVFGSEAPTDLDVHIYRDSIDRRDSRSSILSADVPSSIGSTRRRSNSDSYALLAETKQGSSTSLDLSNSPSDVVLDIGETSSSFCPSSSFSERRRRAAKLTHFFGVNYQDISQLIPQKLLPSTLQLTSSGIDNSISDSTVEVDVKVVGRRFWGLSDGEMKAADVADVIGKLRGLRAG